MRCGESRHYTNSIRHPCFSLGDPRCDRIPVRSGPYLSPTGQGISSWALAPGSVTSPGLDPQPLSISAAVRRHGKNNRKKNGDEFALNARFIALQLECVNKFNAKRSASKRPNPARPAFFGPRTNSCTATPLGERWIENTAGELHSEAVSCMLPAGANFRTEIPD